MEPAPSRPVTPPSRRMYLLVTLFAFALVLMPFLFWQQTWFGRRLSDAQIERSLAETTKPRESQHALVQIGEHLSRGDKSVRRWYPRVIALAGHPALELRQTAAWIMGQDREYDSFREPLHKLLLDPEPMVRRNAALALANFHDESARGELRAMLLPSSLESTAAGVVKYRLKEGEFVNPGTLVARVGSVEVRARLPGELRSRRKPDGAPVAAGDPLAEISAGHEHVWEALRALFLIGQTEDLELVERYSRAVPGMPDKLRQQAVFTARAIQDRK